MYKEKWGGGGTICRLRNTGSVVRMFINPQEKIFALTEEFKINYVCPKCKRFLGDLPWQNLANQKKCVACKATWVK